MSGNSSPDEYAVETFTLFSVGAAVILLRSLTRWSQVGFRHFEADDILMLSVIIPFAAQTALASVFQSNKKGLTNSGMSDDERAALLPTDEQYLQRVSGSKIQLGGWCTYLLVLWSIKAALCVFYFRLTTGLNGYRARIYFGFFLISISYVALVLVIFLSCQPFRHYWQIHPYPGNTCEPALSQVNVYVTLAFNIVSDTYLLLIPVPMLWSVQLPTMTKLGLLFLFSGGALVMAAGVLRSVFVYQDPITGPREGSAWALRETFLAITTSCLPVLWGFIRKFWASRSGSRPVISSHERRHQQHNAALHGPEPGSIMLSDRGLSEWPAANKGKASSTQDDDSNDGGSSREILATATTTMTTTGGIMKEVEICISTCESDEEREVRTYVNGSRV